MPAYQVMSDIVISPRKGYTVIPNGVMPTGLSARAWGVYCYLMSRPPGWVCRPRHLVSVFKEGRDALYAAVNELCEFGLLVKEWVPQKDKPPRVRYVMPDPQSGIKLPFPGNPDTANPDTANQDYNQYSKRVTSREEPSVTLRADGDQDGLFDLQPALEERTEEEPDTLDVDEVVGSGVSPVLTAGSLVAAWWDGWNSANPEMVAFPATVQRMKGIAKSVAKTLKTDTAWQIALAAAFSAGEQGLYDIVQAVPVQRKSSFRTKADEEAEFYRDQQRRFEAEGFVPFEERRAARMAGS